MLAAIKAAKAKGAFDEPIIEEDNSRNLSQLSIEDDDPFSDTAPASKPKVSAAASAFSAAKPSLLSNIVNNARSGNAFSDSEASDDYSADEFSQEAKSPKASLSASNSAKSVGASKLAGMFGGAKKTEAKKAESRGSSRSRSTSPFSSHSKPSAAAAKKKDTRATGRGRSRSRSRSASRSRSPSQSQSRSRSRSRSNSPRRSGGEKRKSGGGMMKLKALLTKDRSNDGKGKSFMDEQKEKLAANPHYVKKQKEIALKKFALAGFMSSAKNTDYSKQVSGLLSDIANCSFKPKLSAGTRELLDKGGSAPVFSERLKGYIQSKIDKHKSLAKLNKDTFSFQPRLNHDRDEDERDKDAEQKRKEFEDRSAADLKRRKDELDRKQRSLPGEFTFQPNLTTYRPRSAKSKLNKSFEKRYYDDLKKRDDGLEAKIAAAKVEQHPFAPQITTNVRVKGSFLERTIHDVEVRNKKMRYRAKLMDLEPPVHGRIHVPHPEDDPFYQNEQRKLSRSATARELRDDMSSSDAGTGRSPQKMVGIVSNNKSMGKFANLTAGLISSFGGNKGMSMSKAIARPEVVSDSHKALPKRGKRISERDRREYEQGLKERRKRDDAYARRHRPVDDQSSRRSSRHSSPGSSRRSSISSRRGGGRAGARSISRSRSPSRDNRSRSRSRSRSNSPDRASSTISSKQSRRGARGRRSRSSSRSPPPQSHGRRSRSRSRSRSASRSRSPSRSSEGSDSIFSDPHSHKKNRRK